MAAMEQQTVEVKFEGEQVGSYTDKNTTTYTLYSLPNSAPDDLCMWCTSMRVMGAGWRPTVAKDSAKGCWGRSSRSWLKLVVLSEFPRTKSTADELALYSPNDLEVEDFSEHD